MSEWLNTTLGDLCADGGGGIQTGPFGSQLHASDYVQVGTPVVMPQNIRDNYVDLDGIARISDAELERLERYELLPGDIVYSRRGDVERRALIRPENAGWLCGTGCLRVRLGDDSAHDATFISYALGLKSTREWIVRHAVGATMLNLNTSILSAVPLRVPGVDEQRAIAEVLGALDDKIAANVRLIEKADALAAALFEDGLDTGYQERPLAEVAVFHNRQRVPLSAKERDARPGPVPYFGAAGRLDYVDEALFDEQLLLVGEDGSVVQEDGRPVTQYIWGPSWVNNHAHVLTGHGVTTELLRLAVRRSSVLSLVTGAVQPKISMRNLKSLPIELPTGHHCDPLSVKVDALMAVIRRRTDENRSLTITRDALLPLLMSGRVTVKDAESVVEGVA